MELHKSWPMHNNGNICTPGKPCVRQRLICSCLSLNSSSDNLDFQSYTGSHGLFSISIYLLFCVCPTVNFVTVQMEILWLSIFHTQSQSISQFLKLCLHLIQCNNWDMGSYSLRGSILRDMYIHVLSDEYNVWCWDGDHQTWYLPRSPRYFVTCTRKDNILGREHPGHSRDLGYSPPQQPAPWWKQTHSYIEL